MILHIVKKDLRRLWPFVAGLVLAHAVFAVMQLRLGLFPDDHQRLYSIVHLIGGDNVPGRLMPAFSLARILGFFLLVMAVQLDPLPGERQDWLVRPIRRRDLLLAKLLFACLTVQLPLLAADLVQGLGAGFPLAAVLGSAAAHNAGMFLGVSLPALALGAVTRSIGQVLGLMLALVIGFLASIMLLVYTRDYTAVQAADHVLSSWMLLTLVLLAGAALVLSLQYFRRVTFIARMALAASFVLALATQLMPQGAAFALEGAGPSQPGPSLAFAPEAGRKAGPAGSSDNMANALGRTILVSLPMRITGLADGDLLWMHQVYGRLTAADGDSTMMGGGNGMPLRLPGQTSAIWYQPLTLQRDEFLRRHAGEKLRLELEYVLSALHPGQTYEMPASGGALDIPGGPHCIARPNVYVSLGEGSAEGADLRSGTQIQLRCEQTGAGGPGLVSSFIAADGRKTVGRRPYVPGDLFLGRAAFLNAAGVAPYGSITRMLQLHDLSVTPPPDAGPLDHAKVAITTAGKTAHLYRRVVIPQIRLEDWAVAGRPDGGL